MTRTFIDLSGKRLAHAVVMEKIRHPVITNRWNWRCICDCGKIFIVHPTTIKTDKNVSCGCKRGINWQKPNNEASYNFWFYVLKRNAKIRGIEIHLNKEQAIDIASLPCHYCGKLQEEVGSARGYKNSCRDRERPFDQKYYESKIVLLNGLDRKDSSLGYTKENVVSCCTQCNMAKNDTPYQEFIDWIATTCNHLLKNNLTFKELE
jgi:hypothetical protein